LTKVAEALSDVGSVDKAPKLEGRSMIRMINPKNQHKFNYYYI
jgi:translation initiation factor IF-3